MDSSSFVETHLSVTNFVDLLSRVLAFVVHNVTFLDVLITVLLCLALLVL